jgi:maleate isomerase
MLATGVPAAVTTSGAVVSALRALGARRVAVATPYDEAITALLFAFLGGAGIAVTRADHLGLDSAIWAVPREVTLGLVRRAWTDDCDAVFVSCTNLATYDAIPELEEELGVPVVSANQATMWAAVALAGLSAQGAGQRLLDEGLPA